MAILYNEDFKGKNLKGLGILKELSIFMKKFRDLYS